MTRQNFYKERKTRRRRAIDEGLVVDLVKSERCLQPRIGGRKLYGLFKEELTSAGVEIGRDRFFEVLRKHDLLVDPLPPRLHRTTDSRHNLPIFRNLIRDIVPSAPNEVWVTDITYIRTDEGFEYLTLIMDRYSRKIVGYHSGSGLDARSSLQALGMALDDLPEGCCPIHHSDRGCQYCSHEYVDVLQGRSLPISMTEENHCYENSHAERLNGILKQEYGLGRTFRTRAQVRAAVHQAVWLYNTRRPHNSLNGHFPASVHAEAA